MTPQKIIRNYLIIAGLYTLSASLIWSVNTLFLLDAGLDIMGVFIANAAFSAGMFIFEIPTGMLADTSGRRVSFLWSTAVLALGTLGYVGIAAIGGSLTLLALPLLLLLRRLNHDADIIVGTAGKQAACAAQGLPEVAAVDPRTSHATA